VCADAEACEHRGVSGRLYLVGTPIGNLGDLTDRARETLRSVDIVAAEDTRRTGRLLVHAGIKRRTISLFEGNERERTKELVAALREGKDVALVSDAGMPSISDPGFRLVRAATEEGIDVRVIPGPSAVTAALVVSGLPVDRFVFEGFLPRRAGERRDRLRALAHDPRTVVVFESPLRLRRCCDVLVRLGDQRMALAAAHGSRESCRRWPRSGTARRLSPRVVVVVLEGHREDEPGLAELVEEARRLVAGGMRKREAASTVARRRNASANAIYGALVART
jgi:16S rRNA (cytidine1402-2'-O)-methyltransferase